MKLIIPVDTRMGMLFHNRRQSMDAVLNTWILDFTQDHNLWMHPYSAKLFPEDEKNIRISDSFLEQANPSDYCFVEAIDPQPYEDAVDEIILCKWNRAYPGDLYFRIDLSDWKLCNTVDLVGSSHEKITLERYTKGA